MSLNCRCLVEGVNGKVWFIFLLLHFFLVPLKFLLPIFFKTRASMFFEFCLIQVHYCISAYFYKLFLNPFL